jgi:hypothetical protein
MFPLAWFNGLIVFEKEFSNMSIMVNLRTPVIPNVKSIIR